MRTLARSAPAFTLVELLLSMAVLSLILVITLSMTSSVTQLFTRTRAKIDTFQEARAGFEAMTRRVSQAMLNTYWDYDFDPSDPRHTGSPKRYARQSELHFISGPTSRHAQALLPDENLNTVTHGIFFQAPTGYSAPKIPSPQNATLNNLLNVSGYYVDFASDLQDRPRFLKSIVSEHHRFRLLEMNVPTENLDTYAVTANLSTSRAWFQIPAANFVRNPQRETDPRGVRTLAENVIALIVYPQRSQNEPAAPGAPAEIAPNYYYDSRAYLKEPTDLNNRTRAQLPPLVQVTMVAIDSRSAERLLLGEVDQTVPPSSLNLESLFAKPSSGDKENIGDLYRRDLQTLEALLIDKGINSRVFSTSVNILQAKWSEN